MDGSYGLSIPFENPITQPGYVNSLLLKIAIEIVDFSIKHGGSFQFATLIYQAGSFTKNLGSSHWEAIFGNPLRQPIFRQPGPVMAIGLKNV